MWASVHLTADYSAGQFLNVCNPSLAADSSQMLPLLSPYSKQHNDNLYGNFMWSPAAADCDLDFRIPVLILNSPASFFWDCPIQQPADGD